MDKRSLIQLTSKIDQNSCPGSINFHCHTNFSDGSMNPEDILEEAYKNKLNYISITDHHTIEAYEYIANKNLLNNTKYNSFELVNGIEINALLMGCLVHIIGLGIDIKNPSLNPYINGESAIGSNLHSRAVIKAISEAGGLSFLAHPARYRISFDKLILEAFKLGFDGIEVWYDYGLNTKWQPSYFICDEINKLTDNYKMLKSCGTDSHGYSLLGR